MPITEHLAEEAFHLACSGVYVPVPHGPCSLRAFLQEGLGMDPGYVEQRVQTIMLHGLAVDSLNALLRPGARLALSAAMPGVAGATLRRGGHYAPMRRSITLLENASDPANSSNSAATGEGFWVELRCFNDIAREQGSALLRRGVAVVEARLGPILHTLAIPLPSYLPPAPAPGLVWLCLS